MSGKVGAVGIGVGCGSDCFSWSGCCRWKWEWCSGLHWVLGHWSGLEWGGCMLRKAIVGFPVAGWLPVWGIWCWGSEGVVALGGSCGYWCRWAWADEPMVWGCLVWLWLICIAQQSKFMDLQILLCWCSLVTGQHE